MIEAISACIRNGQIEVPAIMVLARYYSSNIDDESHIERNRMQYRGGLRIAEGLPILESLIANGRSERVFFAYGGFAMAGTFVTP